MAKEIGTTPGDVRLWVRVEEQRTGQQIVPQQQDITSEQEIEDIISSIGEEVSSIGEEECPEVLLEDEFF